ncbi:MAG: hypothetical protein AB7S49_05330 [Arcobacter sp.]|jgi:hypothetical protein|uniref:Membrane protein n=1 Tax=Arcobacter defluvii TaxID=873191 RepID=A0AAE7BGB7_9BACT|nr:MULTISPECIES: hypothetical protein [Arcobacter]MDY3200056.1 hypothetical protein [Arcobacter sp.]QKF77244.1 putative membrane protein [Arcobacter defluvii]RXI33467.1 hypothetical protein CP964_05605 [Arcobacter defluvii]BAK73125.1 conserved hypothetical protein [Arcobacter sp. L]
MTRNNLDNPLFLFIVLVIAITVNTIASIHFLLIMLAGIIFTAFYRCLKKRYLYSLTFVILAFLFIEINSGLKPFSLSLLSLFIYIFILPKVDNSTSYNLTNSYIYILFFYIGLIIMWSLSFGMDERIFLSLVVNLIIDLIFFGVFL